MSDSSNEQMIYKNTVDKKAVDGKTVTEKMTAGRFIVVIIDSLGIGAMADAAELRPLDSDSNTALHIIQNKPEIQIPTFEKLGLMNTIGQSFENHLLSATANWGFADLAHFGADSFLGHQEMMGTKPKQPLIRPFIEKIDDVETVLNKQSYRTYRVGDSGGPQILVVNDCVTVGDNLETDPGQVYNVTGCLDLLSFEELRDIGVAVREVSDVSRVITFGGTQVTLKDLLAAIKVKGNLIAGVDAPKSGVYHNGYQVVHLGYGIDPMVQVPMILERQGIYVALFGKIADIVFTENSRCFPGVDSEELFEKLFREVQAQQFGFFCLNIQETDIAGHLGDVDYYADRLQLCDRALMRLLPVLSARDILIVTADHGNDPTIGHSNHTRERVPILAYSPGISGKYIGERKTLADIGATVSEYFGTQAPGYGTSFLERLFGASVF
jgi:phosphopentomutase